MPSQSSKVAKGDSSPRLRRFSRVLPCVLILICEIFSSDALGQEALPGIDIGAETVVTPDRVDEPASCTASSVTVVSAADIQKRGSKGFTDVLRGVPGLDIFEAGGPGSQTSVFLRGSTPVEGGFTGYDSSIRFDNPFAFVAADVFDPFNHQHSTFVQGFARVDADMFDHMLHNRLTLFANVTNRDVWQTESCFDANFNALNCRLGFRGGRRGLEYQGDLKLGPSGLVTFGARDETESVHTSQDPSTLDTFTPINAEQTTHSGFAQHQFTVFDRLDVTFGGRVDAVEDNHTFETWRTTAAFRIEETGTKLRATAGTGARVASLFQRFSQYGDPALRPEARFASVSLYENRFRNLIDFSSSPSCSATQVIGCYFTNVVRTETMGVEFAGEAVIPDELRIRATYTYLIAKNLVTERTLFRRPRDKGSASIIYTGIPSLEIEARVTVVGPNPDFDFINSRRVTLAPHAKLDIFANYKLDDRLSIFGRIENVGDVRYEEVLNYGTAGRSFYGWMKLTW